MKQKKVREGMESKKKKIYKNIYQNNIRLYPGYHKTMRNNKDEKGKESGGRDGTKEEKVNNMRLYP